MTEERLALVKPGMTREQVEAAWGKPQLAQEVEGELRLCYNESTLEMGFMGIGSTVEAKTTIVVLRDGLVVEVRKSSSGK